MSKKTSAIVLSSLIVMNQVSDITLIHASNSTDSAVNLEQSEVNQKESDKQSKQVIYLTNGEGSSTVGDGTEEHPYQNINKALDAVEDGGVIKLVGMVLYTKHDVHPTSKAALPLTITKNITFEGEDSTNDGIYSRAPIQLEADVTFKNMRIQLTNNNQIMPGVPEPAPTPADEGIYKSGRTIYTAGHTLTLDNVNTRLGTSDEQIDDRPFISGGAFWASRESKNQSVLGTKSVVKIINPNDNTRFSAIYASDYWYPSDIPFELTLGESTNNKTIIDKNIHTGGIMSNYTGDVTINIAGDTSQLGFDNTQHTGNTDVNITSSTLLNNIDFNNVRNLTLSDKAYVEVPSDTTFEIKNLSIKDDALLDFRKLNSNPKINGNFTGETTNSKLEGGAIALNTEQTLEINGVATGNTRLNTHDKLSQQILKQNTPYIIADERSDAKFIIKPAAIQEDLKLQVNEDINDQNQKVWTVTGNVSQVFKDFEWDNTVEDQIDTPHLRGEYAFPIYFINEFDEYYRPENSVDFKLTLIKEDGTVVDEESTDNDVEIFLDWTNNEALLSIKNEDFVGDVTLKLEHTDGKVITKTVTRIKDATPLTGKIQLNDNPKVGETLTVIPNNLPQDVTGLKYKWFIDGKQVSDGTEPTFDLQEEHLGKQVRVEVRANNYTDFLESNTVTVVTNKLMGTVAIEGTPQVGETLTAVTKGMQTDSENIKYTWFADDVEITDQTNKTIQLKPEYVGKKITVEVSASNYNEKLVSSAVTVILKKLSGDIEITGGTKVGQTLTATTSNFPSDANLTYQWFADGKAIDGATNKTFIPTIEQIGQTIRVGVSSTNYSGGVLSDEITIEKNELNGQLKINGTPKVGQTLTANTDGFPTDANLEYQWFADEKEIANATESTLDLTEDFIGKSITVKVTSPHYTGTIESSSVTVLTNQLTGSVIIEGTPEVGQTLTATTSDVQEDANAKYQWFANGTAIPTATTSTLHLTSEFIGQEITVQITSENYTGNLTSSKVVVSKSELTGDVVITGTPKVGQTLTATTSNFPSDANLTYQWFVNGNEIANATQSTLELTSDYAGKRITVKVSSTNHDGMLASSEVLVLTNQAPIIHGLNSVKLNMREVDTFNQLDGVTVEDDHDKNLVPTVTNTIVKPQPDQTLTSTLTYTVTDSDGNKTTMDRLVTVTNYVPTIQANSITIKAGETIDLLTDSRINLAATDIEDGDLKANVKVTNSNGLDVNNPSVGTYPITYSVTDLDGNSKDITVTIQVQSNDAPTINGVTATTIKLSEVDTFDKLAGITVTDDHDQNLVPTVKGTITKPQPGQTSTSKLTYTVTDSHGNKTTLDRQITVTNYLPTLQVNSITIKANQSINLLTDSRLSLSATDVEDGDLTSHISVKDYGGLNPNQPVAGDYTVTYTITDSDGNTINQSTTVKVESNDAPVISGTDNQVIQSGTTFDVLAGVVATDTEDGQIANIHVIETFDPYQIGDQSITYQVTDSDGNTTTVTRVITVAYETELPTDNTVSKMIVPHTQAQLDLLVNSIKNYDKNAVIVDMREDVNHYIYKIKITHTMTQKTTVLSEYFIEIKLAKSINDQVDLPVLTPEVTPEDTNKPSSPEVTPEDTNKPSSPEVTPEDTNKPSSPEVTPEDTNKPSSPEVTPEDSNKPSLPEVTPEDSNKPSSPEVTPEDSNNTVEDETTSSSNPVTGYTGFAGYLGGAFITLGSILSFKKKKK